MVIIQFYPLAVILCVITMLCWGSWANTQKLASQKWPFQLFYWDYALGVVLLTLVFAFTMGSSGTEGRPFLDDLSQGKGSALGSAFIGGVVFNLANILLVAAIDLAGMAVAFPIGIGLALALGVVVNYAAVPEGNPLWLFLGVAFIVAAIILTAIAYRKLPSDGNRQTSKGIIISLVAGVLMGFFYRFVAASMASDFAQPEAGMLTPYTALVLFSLGLLASNFLFNSWMMYRPLAGQATTYAAYFQQGTPRLHLIGVLGGVIWGVGMSLNILASGAAGPAISYGLGQGATMVAAIWGVFIWKEFASAPKGTNRLINLMFVCFIVGLGLIIYSRLS
ncbi:MAG: multidrug DMT transporter permease [Bacteroidota bacterium]